MQDSNYRCNENKQKELARLLIIFIIRFVQPLYILKNDAFREFIHACEPGFVIPCEKTVKDMIHEAYNWTKDQLINLLGSTVTSIHLTTDLWTSKSNHGYIGITATWLSSDFVFHEALLTCNHLEYPHTGEAISNELYRLIEKWHLSNSVFTISTDNGSNMVKSVNVLSQSLSSIKRQPCAAHTLQLSVNEGLKQCKSIHKRVKCLQNFFRLPKQAQRLREAQLEMNGRHLEDQSDGFESPLDVLNETKTRWNSTFLAWKRIIELHNAMRFVTTSLMSKNDRSLNKEGERLDRMCLTHEEKV